MISALNNFMTRKQAKSALISKGEDCVDILIKELSSPLRDNVKWTMIDVLAAIGSNKAVPILLECAKDPTFEGICKDTIKKITGKYPEDTEEKKKEAENETANVSSGQEVSASPEVVPSDTNSRFASKTPEEKEPAPEPKVIEKVVEIEKKPITPEEAKKIIEKIIEENKFEDKKTIKGGYRFIIKTEKGRRRQRINVYYDTTNEDGEKVICIYSVCCDADPKHYEHALKWNQNVAHGAIGLIETKGKKQFVLLRHLSLVEAGKETILKEITLLGDRADKIEKVLTGSEDFR